MSRQLDRFMNDVRVRLPGAIDDAIKLEMFATFDQFCKETNAWQEKILLEVNSDSREYEIEPEENRALIVRLLWVAPESENSEFLQPIPAVLPRTDTIIFRDLPSSPTTYAVTVALTVIDPVNANDKLPEFPDELLTLYSQDILNGVLSRMMSQAAKPYFSKEGFLYHGRLFRNAISRVRISVLQQNTYGTQVWRYPAFA